jgi:hypothetical protein
MVWSTAASSGSGCLSFWRGLMRRSWWKHIRHAHTVGWSHAMIARHAIGPLHARERTRSSRESVGWRGWLGLLQPHRIQIMVVGGVLRWARMV